MRFLDIVLSGVAIVLLTPCLFPVVVLLLATGEHQVFYRQSRIGRGGKSFGLLKFATMLKDSPNLPGGLFTSKSDPRMLPMGVFLRKTKINELPQLINVFVGQMSLVGYRPTVAEHFEGYPKYAREALEKSRPGITGIGSIAFRGEEEILHNFDDKMSFHRDVISPYKAELEFWFLERRSLVLYVQILVLTVVAILKPNEGLWKRWFRDIPAVPPRLKPFI